MNITKELQKQKQAVDLNYEMDNAVKTVLLLENKSAQEDLAIAKGLGGNNSITRGLNEKGKMLEMVKLNTLYKGDVFTLAQIKVIAKKYNLRFLNSKFYCGNLPVEALSKMKTFSKETNTELNTANLSYNFFILGPEKCFKLEEMKRAKVDPDPAIFFKIDDDKYRMIHQWGSDFNVINRFSGWLYQSRINIFLTLFTLTMSVTWGLVHFLNGHPLFYLFFIMAFLVSAAVSFSDAIDDTEFHEEKWMSNTKLVK